jgi:hypothetical protein
MTATVKFIGSAASDRMCSGALHLAGRSRPFCVYLGGCRQSAKHLPVTDASKQCVGGWGGIRTPGEREPTPVFKTGALNHSATHPASKINHLAFRKSKQNPKLVPDCADHYAHRSPAVPVSAFCVSAISMALGRPCLPGRTGGHRSATSASDRHGPACG